MQTVTYLLCYKVSFTPTSNISHSINIPFTKWCSNNDRLESSITRTSGASSVLSSINRRETSIHPTILPPFSLSFYHIYSQNNAGICVFSNLFAPALELCSDKIAKLITIHQLNTGCPKSGYTVDADLYGLCRSGSWSPPRHTSGMVWRQLHAADHHCPAYCAGRHPAMREN